MVLLIKQDLIDRLDIFLKLPLKSSIFQVLRETWNLKLSLGLMSLLYNQLQK